MAHPDENKFWGWGKKDQKFDQQTSSLFLKHLELLYGKLGEKIAPPHYDEFAIAESKLPHEFLEYWKLKGLSTEKSDRINHAVGKSYRDLVRLRTKQLSTFPDGVLFLRQASDLPELFSAASKTGITLVPFGGGTSVAGGTECLTHQNRPVVIVSLRELCKLVSIDEISKTATFEAGILGPDLEKILQAKGFTLGHFPQSFEFSTLGGWAVTRSAGQNSTKFGKIEKLVTSIKMITPAGTIETRPTPASATGPSLKELIVGSEGLFGIVTEVTVKISKISESERFIAGFAPDFKTAADAIRMMTQEGLQPSVIRLSDPSETAMFQVMQKMNFVKKFIFEKWKKRNRLPENPSFFLVSTEGKTENVKMQEKAIRKLFKQRGLVLLSGSRSQHMGEKWKKSRFALPYLRDDLMDFGIFIDTLETSTTWSNLNKLADEMTTAFELREKTTHEKLIVGFHLSHSYPDGASLYFTIVGKQRKNSELDQWTEIKKTATDTLMLYGGALSHHHGIGCDHAPWMQKEYTGPGMAALWAMKEELDPTLILNPGKFF